MMEKTSGETVCSGTICLGVPEQHTSKGHEKFAKEMERTVYDNGGTPAGSVLSL